MVETGNPDNVLLPPGSDVQGVASSATLDTRDRFEIQKRLFADRRVEMIFDAGAHTGRTADSYRVNFPDADIHCFEANEQLYRGLKERFECNPRVRVHPAAVHEQSGTAEFHINKLAATSSLLPRDLANRRYFSGQDATIERRSVPAVGLDEFCEQHKIERVNILKLDIQGGEKFALRGARRLLAGSLIDLLFVEVFFVEHYREALLFHELTQFLSTFDYSLYDLFIDRHGRNGQVRFGDAIYISAPMRRDVVDRYSPEP